jgi:hypothetical protein
MSEMSAVHRSSSLCLRDLTLLMVGLIPLTGRPAHCQNENNNGTLYFIAGTPTNDGPETYSASLYRLDLKHQQLQLVRELIDRTSGLYSVEGDQHGTIALAFPHVNPTSITIVHPNNPGQVDVVSFLPVGTIVLSSGVSVSTKGIDTSKEIFPTVVPDKSGQDVDPVLIAVAFSPALNSARVNKASITDYKEMVYGGMPGGPAFNSVKNGSAEANKIEMKYGSQTVTLAELSSEVATALNGKNLAILGRNSQYMVVCVVQSMDDLTRSSTRDVYIHDRKTNKWSKWIQPGNLSRSRLFGSWLVTTIQQGRDGGERTNAPEQSGEDALTKRQYDSFQGSVSDIPGEIRFYNLKTRQTLSLKTGQEDTEVLGVHLNSVIYRVNNALYGTVINGNDLQESHVLFQGPEVRQVHWMLQDNYTE